MLSESIYEDKQDEDQRTALSEMISSALTYCREKKKEKNLFFVYLFNYLFIFRKKTTSNIVKLLQKLLN